ncbi:MAG: hypothetical protein RIC87_17270 [Kiloniellales bacterium]
MNAGQRSVGMPVRRRRRTVLSGFGPLLCLIVLAACQQTVGLSSSGSSVPATGGTSVSSSATTPASLLPGGATPSFSQTLAGSGGFANVVDRQGVSWSVEIGRPYDSASGKVCKPLRFTSLSRAGNFDRIACSDKLGIWEVVPPLQGDDSGPSF